MSQEHQFLYDEVCKLPYEKISKAVSYIRYLEQEPEPELILEAAEEAALRELLASGGSVSSAELLAMIEALPDD